MSSKPRINFDDHDGLGQGFVETEVTDELEVFTYGPQKTHRNILMTIINYLFGV